MPIFMLTSLCQLSKVHRRIFYHFQLRCNIWLSAAALCTKCSFASHLAKHLTQVNYTYLYSDFVQFNRNDISGWNDVFSLFSSFR